MKTYTLGESIILLACKKIVSTMLGNKAALKVSKIPLSNDTVCRRILEMSFLYLGAVRLYMGHSMTNRHKKNFFLTTTSPILIKIGVCGYLIAKTHWCKYFVSTTNTF